MELKDEKVIEHGRYYYPHYADKNIKHSEDRNGLKQTYLMLLEYCSLLIPYLFQANSQDSVSFSSLETNKGLEHKNPFINLP
jgi:hypothetical protein